MFCLFFNIFQLYLANTTKKLFLYQNETSFNLLPNTTFTVLSYKRYFISQTNVNINVKANKTIYYSFEKSLNCSRIPYMSKSKFSILPLKSTKIPIPFKKANQHIFEISFCSHNFSNIDIFCFRNDNFILILLFPYTSANINNRILKGYRLF